MRLCDRDIEAWLDEGRLAINPRPPVERINGATVDVRLGNKFRTFRGHTAPFIDLSGPKAEVSAALDRVMSEEIVLPEGDEIDVFLVQQYADIPGRGRQTVVGGGADHHRPPVAQVSLGRHGNRGSILRRGIG